MVEIILSQENNKEAILEEIYLDGLTLLCPLQESLSMGQFVGKLIKKELFTMPTKFSELQEAKLDLTILMAEKTDKFSDSDYENYLVWKIWQYKRSHFSSIISDKAKVKALLIPDQQAKEVYKALSKIEKIEKRLMACETPKDYEWIREELLALNNRVFELSTSLLMEINKYKEINLIEPNEETKLIEGDNENE